MSRPGRARGTPKPPSGGARAGSDTPGVHRGVAPEPAGHGTHGGSAGHAVQPGGGAVQPGGADRVPGGGDRMLAAGLAAHDGAEVRLCGWVHRQRDLGRICFLILRDRSGLCQVVFGEAPVDAAGRPITLESVVEIRGRVAANRKAPGGYEVQAQALTVISAAAPELPLAVNQDPALLSLDAMLEHRMVSLRNPKTLSIFRLQAEIVRLFAEHLRAEGFTEIKSSKLIGSGTEGGTGLFAVEYFDRTVYLAQSPQLYKQALVAAGLERVFEIGMAYRAEKHDTPRHINEYVSLDVEMAFIDSEHDLMDLEQRLLGTICAGLERSASTLLAHWGEQALLPTAEQVAAIPRLSHAEARAVIAAASGRTRVYDINPEGERHLCDWAAAEHGVPAVFVYAYPRRKRPFYTYPSGANQTMSFDLLYRGQELTSGGRRINDYATLVDSIERFGLDPAAMSDYLSVFRYGCPPHGGFAIGLERLTQTILGLASVKQASLFPRDRKRVRP